MSTKDKTPDRFWGKVHTGSPEECWTWNGGLTRGGYGAFKVNGVQGRAHRYSFFLANGFYPPIVMHGCDNPPCVNPAHLTGGTQALNMADCVAKGRFVKAQTLKTHCPKGHEYNSENTYMHGNNRQCRACRKIKSAKWAYKIKKNKGL